MPGDGFLEETCFRIAHSEQVHAPHVRGWNRAKRCLSFFQHLLGKHDAPVPQPGHATGMGQAAHAVKGGGIIGSKQTFVFIYKPLEDDRLAC